MGALLEVENVSRRFGGVVALDGVSLDAGENEIVGLIGPNGAGKTTLFNVVTRLSRPDSGELLRPPQVDDPRHAVRGQSPPTGVGEVAHVVRTHDAPEARATPLLSR